MGDPKRIEGFFIEFNEEEIEAVRQVLAANGYSPDGKGIKQFLLFALFDNEENDDRSSTRNFIGNLQNYIRDNPESIDLAISAIKNIAGKIKRFR